MPFRVPTFAALKPRRSLQIFYSTPTLGFPSQLVSKSIEFFFLECHIILIVAWTITLSNFDCWSSSQAGFLIPYAARYAIVTLMRTSGMMHCPIPGVHENRHLQSNCTMNHSLSRKICMMHYSILGMRTRRCSYGLMLFVSIS